MTVQIFRPQLWNLLYPGAYLRTYAAVWKHNVFHFLFLQLVNTHVCLPEFRFSVIFYATLQLSSD